MANTLKGVGLIANVNGIALTAGIVSGTTKGAIQSSRHTRTSDKYDVANALGDTIASNFYNHKVTWSVTAIPYHDTTVSGARTAADAWQAAAGTLITATDADGTILDDNYNLLSATQGRSNTGAATVELELEAFEANEVATAPIT